MNVAIPADRNDPRVGQTQQGKIEMREGKMARMPMIDDGMDFWFKAALNKKNRYSRGDHELRNSDAKKDRLQLGDEVARFSAS